MAKLAALSVCFMCSVAAGCCIQTNMTEDQNAQLIEQSRDMEQQVSAMRSRNSELKRKIESLREEEAYLLKELREGGL